MMTDSQVNKMVIKDLNLYYGDYLAVKDLSLDVIKNQALAFIGPSGCGKSSTLKCLNRMNDLVEGSRIEGIITLDGEDIYDRKFDEFFYFPRTYRVESGCRFVHKNYLRLNRKRPCNAKSLLLTSGKFKRILSQIVLDFVPKIRLLQRPFYNLLEFRLLLYAVRLRTVHNIFADAHRKRSRSLENHPYSLS